MSIIDKFGSMVGSEALQDPEKARNLLLAGYHLQEARLLLAPDKELPPSGRYAALPEGDNRQGCLLYTSTRSAA